mgnify:CR=1 FL=1
MKVLVLGNGAHVKKRVLPALNNIKSIENIIIDNNLKNFDIMSILVILLV